MKDNQNGEPTNEVKGWKPVEGAQQAAAAPSAPKQPVSAGGAPW